MNGPGIGQKSERISGNKRGEVGLALLIVALIRIPANQGQIRVYHFSVASDLAWFSSNPYLSPLVILREEYFKTSTVVRTIRAVGTAAMLGLMIVQTVYMGDKLWNDYFNCPTECLIEHLKIGGSNGTMSRDDIFWLLWGYSLLLGSMFKCQIDSTRTLSPCLTSSLNRSRVYTYCHSTQCTSPYESLEQSSALFIASLPRSF